MKTALLLVAGLGFAGLVAASAPAPVFYPGFDMEGYLRVAAQAARHRESRRLSEAQFIEMSREPGTLVLDARSAESYARLHVRGAVNLSFPDIALASLAERIPDKSTRILIYCNNNFPPTPSAGRADPFPSKLPSASLNLATFVALYNYEYRNVYELGPVIDPAQSRLEWAGDQGSLREVQSLRW
jgi:hypothetical protein